MRNAQEKEATHLHSFDLTPSSQLQHQDQGPPSNQVQIAAHPTIPIFFKRTKLDDMKVASAFRARSVTTFPLTFFKRQEVALAPIIKHTSLSQAPTHSYQQDLQISSENNT